jgi:hypothetical protein
MLHKIKQIYQKFIRGYSDDEVCDLDHTFCKWVVPRLKLYKRENHGFPSTLTAYAWDNILDEMIEGFEIAQEGYMPWQKQIETDQKVLNAYKLFGIWGTHLWV